ncbi:hypothetical protein Bca52824_079031 [Brassica carinata]|uniref:Uncharacterized protein n=1 Tax=Brassica carinata TaxID=52824 RepID=A0A8X7PZH0_BRACI|nr:hypothetical protein Bca52824_079031 [Brassica carinata]
MDGGPGQHFASLSKKRPRGSFSLTPHSKPKAILILRKKPVRLTHAIPGESKTLEYESTLTLEQSDVASSMISATWE